MTKKIFLADGAVPESYPGNCASLFVDGSSSYLKMKHWTSYVSFVCQVQPTQQVCPTTVLS